MNFECGQRVKAKEEHVRQVWSSMQLRSEKVSSQGGFVRALSGDGKHLYIQFDGDNFVQCFPATMFEREGVAPELMPDPKAT